MPLLLVLAQVDEEKRAADSKVTYEIGNIQQHVGRGDRGGAGVGFLRSGGNSHGDNESKRASLFKVQAKCKRIGVGPSQVQRCCSFSAVASDVAGAFESTLPRLLTCL